VHDHLAGQHAGGGLDGRGHRQRDVARVGVRRDGQVHQQPLRTGARARREVEPPVVDVAPADERCGHGPDVDREVALGEREHRHQRRGPGAEDARHRATAAGAGAVGHVVDEVARAPAQQRRAAQAELGQHELPRPALLGRLAGQRVDLLEQLEVGVGVQPGSRAALRALPPRQPVAVRHVHGEHAGTGRDPAGRCLGVSPLVGCGGADEQHRGERPGRCAVERVEQGSGVGGGQGQHGRGHQAQRVRDVVLAVPGGQQGAARTERAELERLHGGGPQRRQRAHHDVAAAELQHLPEPRARASDDVEVRARAGDREAQRQPCPHVGGRPGVRLDHRRVRARRGEAAAHRAAQLRALGVQRPARLAGLQHQGRGAARVAVGAHVALPRGRQPGQPVGGRDRGGGAAQVLQAGAPPGGERPDGVDDLRPQRVGLRRPGGRGRAAVPGGHGRRA
jgi:hypothetical protein